MNDYPPKPSDYLGTQEQWEAFCDDYKKELAHEHELREEARQRDNERWEKEYL